LVEIHAFAIVQRRYGGKPSPAAARNCRLKTADEKYNAGSFLQVVSALEERRSNISKISHTLNSLGDDGKSPRTLAQNFENIFLPRLGCQ
jgi:hypothetical protein